MKIKRYTMFLILLVLITNLLVGCGDKSANADIQAKKIIMGLDDTFAPMGFRDESGELVGFDIELAKEVAKKLDVEIEFQPIDWSMKETELNTGNIDLIWNGYSITEERKEKVAFSTPYLANSQIVVTLADSSIVKLADLEGLAVAVQAESSAVDAAHSKEDLWSL